MPPTGKEIIASYIHQNSARRSYPFIAINCSAFSDTLLESRLFGYRKGAFTDAKKDTKGLFQEAEGGTLFLDEIGDISPYMQQSLLRALQEKEIHPIGGKPFSVDVRIIAATNRDLLSLCKAEKYRWDLYYRLAVAEIDLPPLRERGVIEIEDMLHFFLRQKQKEMHHPYPLKFEREAWNKLLQYTFPGNIREMENMIESLYVFCEREVTMDDLPKRLQQQTSSNYLLAQVEREHILKVDKLFAAQKKKAAQALGISYNTFKNRLKQYQKEG